MNDWKHVSASQTKTHEMCNRKWWFYKIAGLPTPPSGPAAQLGSEVHTVIEEYLKSRKSPQLGVTPSKAWRIAREGMKFWPISNKTISIEKQINFTFDPDLPPFMGFIDILDVRKDYIEIIDHKTTGNWAYALTEERLKEDIQMIVYAKWVLETYPKTKFVRLTHLQYATKGKSECRKVTIDVTKRHINTVFKRVANAVAQMKIHSTVRSKKDVPVNLGACSAFGGCPFYTECNANSRPFKSLNKTKQKDEPMSSTLQELLAKKKAAQVEASTPTEAQIELPFALELAPDSGDRKAAPVVDEGKKNPLVKLTTDDHRNIMKQMLEEKPKSIPYARVMIKRIFNMQRVASKHVTAAIELSGGRIVLTGNALSYDTKREESSPNASQGTFRLFINCLPEKEIDQFDRLIDILRPYINEVSEQFDIDPLLMDFAKGPKHVAYALSKGPVLKGNILIDTSDPYWPACSVHLRKMASVIYRGI